MKRDFGTWSPSGDDTADVCVNRSWIHWNIAQDRPPYDGARTTQTIEDFVARGASCGWSVPATVVDAVRAYCASGAWRDEDGHDTLRLYTLNDGVLYLGSADAFDSTPPEQRPAPDVEPMMTAWANELVADGWRVVERAAGYATLTRPWRPPPSSLPSPSST